MERMFKSRRMRETSVSFGCRKGLQKPGIAGRNNSVTLTGTEICIVRRQIVSRRSSEILGKTKFGGKLGLLLAGVASALLPAAAAGAAPAKPCGDSTASPRGL